MSEDDLSFLDIISEYHIRESYPSPLRKLPPREEIKAALEFTNDLFNKICTLLSISIDKTI